jgi:hypothetical protein
MDGQGILKVSKYSYEGNFRQSQKHGKGKITWITGDYYEG